MAKSNAQTVKESTQRQSKQSWLAKKQIHEGRATIATIENDCKRGFLYVLPGGKTTDDGAKAGKAATLMNKMIIECERARYRA